MGQHCAIHEPGEIALQKGQAFFEQLPAGTVLRVAAGSAVLIQHLALEQGQVHVRRTIARGEYHYVEYSAWITLQALGCVQILVYMPVEVTTAQLIYNWLSALSKWAVAPRKIVRWLRLQTIQ